MRIAVVPQVPNVLMNTPNIVVAHHHLVGGGFEAGVATVPNHIFHESRNAVITNMVLTADKAYDIESAGVECPRMGLHVPIAWRDNRPPPHNVRGGLWGRERCRMGGVDASGGRQISLASRGRQMGGVNASGGGRIAITTRGCRMGGVVTSGGRQIGVASRGLVTKALINALRGAVGLE